MVTIIIPTTCERSAELRRAIESVAAQASVIVVVNGDRFDRVLFDSLKADPRLAVYYRGEGNVSSARHHGRQHVSTPYFGFLDDDDELLADTLLPKVKQMESDKMIDVLVTNGYVREQEDKLMVLPGASINGRAMEAFMDGNWFASPAPLFRRSTIPCEAFDFKHRFYEWTYLFFSLLAAGKRIHYSDAITYRKYEDGSAHVSKSEQYELALPAFLKSLLALSLPENIKMGLRRKYVAALNASSQIHLAHKGLGKAAVCHLKCVMSGGLRYVPYTRKLLFALWH